MDNKQTELAMLDRQNALLFFHTKQRIEGIEADRVDDYMNSWGKQVQDWQEEGMSDGRMFNNIKHNLAVLVAVSNGLYRLTTKFIQIDIDEEFAVQDERLMENLVKLMIHQGETQMSLVRRLTDDCARHQSDIDLMVDFIVQEDLGVQTGIQGMRMIEWAIANIRI